MKRKRVAQRHELENQDQVVRVFKDKAKQGIDYSCCCCNRILFQNQVLRCEKIHMLNMSKQRVLHTCVFRTNIITNAQVHVLLIATRHSYGFVTHATEKY